jgi:hypothetical protein
MHTQFCWGDHLENGKKWEVNIGKYVNKVRVK